MTTWEKRSEPPGAEQAPPAAGTREPAAVPVTATPPQRQGRAARRSRWTDERYWQRWAVRLLASYTLLALAMTGLRVGTAEIRPALKEAAQQHQQLLERRAALSLEVQELNSAPRIRQWAEEQGLVRFADSPKRTADFGGVPAPAAQEPGPPLEMRLDWGGER